MVFDIEKCGLRIWDDIRSNRREQKQEDKMRTGAATETRNNEQIPFHLRITFLKIKLVKCGERAGGSDKVLLVLSFLSKKWKTKTKMRI